MTLYQQGDILLIQIENIPQTMKQKEGKIIAEGEATGHCHTITKGDAVLYCDEKGNLSLEVKSDEAILTHEEHKPVTLPKGNYKISRVLEYDHFLEESRRVSD